MTSADGPACCALLPLVWVIFTTDLPLRNVFFRVEAIRHQVEDCFHPLTWGRLF